MEDRLTELEIRAMHQERALQDLFDTVYTQQKSIEGLERQVEQLREQMNLVLPSLIKRGEDEAPPPHY